MARTIRNSQMNKTDKQEDLPETAQVYIFVSLMSKPEVGIETQFLHNAKPLSGHGADHNNQQADKQEVNPKFLEFRFITRNCRGNKQARCQPGSSNPENTQLHVPGPGKGIGKKFGQRKAITALFLLPHSGQWWRPEVICTTIRPLPPKNILAWPSWKGLALSPGAGLFSEFFLRNHPLLFERHNSRRAHPCLPATGLH